jgi:hypothetical protein
MEPALLNGFWSKELLETMLAELLIPILILVGSSILFGVWGRAGARFMQRFACTISALSHLELAFEQLNAILVGVAERISKAFKKLQTGSSNINLLFLMGGLLLLVLLMAL